MADELDFDGIPDNPDELDGYKRVLPGRYHVILANVEEYGGKNHDQLVLDYQILKGTAAGMEGRVHRDFIPYEAKEWVKKKRAKLAFVLGLVTPAQVAAAKKEGKGIAINWDDAKGRHFGILVEEDTYEGKTRSKTPWANNVFALNSADAEGIPIDQAALRATGADDPFGNPKQNGSGVVAGSAGKNGPPQGLGKNGAPAAGAASSSPQRTAAAAPAPAPSADDMFA